MEGCGNDDKRRAGAAVEQLGVLADRVARERRMCSDCESWDNCEQTDRLRAFAQSGAEHSGEASAIRDAWRMEGVRRGYAAVHELRDVDAFCAVS